MQLPSQAAEGALETTTVRIAKIGAICLAPQYVSEELLRAEGFTDIRYVEVGKLRHRTGDRARRGGFQYWLCDRSD